MSREYLGAVSVALMVEFGYEDYIIMQKNKVGLKYSPSILTPSFSQLIMLMMA